MLGSNIGENASMSTVPPTKAYLAHMVMWVGFFLAIPLWREVYDVGHPIWNAFLTIFLIAVVAGVFFGVRHLQRNKIEVGEARFPPRDPESR